MKSILIATDFSRNSTHAAVYGYHLAGQLGADLTLAHAQIIPAEILQDGLNQWTALPYNEMHQDDQAALIRLRTKLEAINLPATSRPEIHYLQQDCAMTQMLAGQASDLVVMGTHGNDWFTTLLIGDHCRKAIETLDVPLLIIPPDQRPERIGKLVFASDFCDPVKDLKALRWLVELARPLGAEVVLVHIYEGREHSARFGKLAASLLEDLGAHTGYDLISAATLDHDSVEEGLQDAVKTLHANILVLRHQPHAWIHELLMGDHSEKLARVVHLPLLVLKSG